MARIIPIPLGITKAFLVRAREGADILIDTGCPDDEKRMVAALAKESLTPADLKLILLTHGHYDHCGSTRKLKELTAAPVALHQADVHLARQGICDPLRRCGLGARLVQLISYKRFLPFEPDLVIEEERDLRAFGVRGRILLTPGHTAGSISVLLDGGDAIVGDLMMGGYLGGWLLPQRPGYHYFADDLPALERSIRKLMEQGAQTIFTAHGGPLTRQAVLRRFGE